MEIELGEFNGGALFLDMELLTVDEMEVRKIQRTEENVVSF